MGTKVTQIAVVTCGVHEVVRVWIGGKLSGELTVGLGEGDHVVKLLMGTASDQRIAELERALGDHGARGFSCPHCAKTMTFCEKHGPYRRTDENQCPACWRGE